MNIALDVNAINQIIDALADRPYRQVAGLIADITLQANAHAQAEQKVAAAQAADAKADGEELERLRAATVEKAERDGTPIFDGMKFSSGAEAPA